MRERSELIVVPTLIIRLIAANVMRRMRIYSIHRDLAVVSPTAGSRID
jgi:hypothetical protein